MFNCDRCGLCCRQLHLNPMYVNLHSGDGVCMYLDQETNMCQIYNERPFLCSVDNTYEMLYKDQMTREEFYELNYKECRKLKEQAGLAAKETID